MIKTNKKEASIYLKPMVILALLTGILYNSWPLGYVLNPVVARDGLASELEALSQPYNWLFIACDIATGLLVIYVSWHLWRQLQLAKHKKVLTIALGGIVAFGVGTIVDTLLPMTCEPSLRACPDFTQDYMLLMHGIFSIIAAIGLFVSLALVWWCDRRSKTLGALMLGYAVFGLISLDQAITPSPSNWSQHYYLILCGLWLAIIPYVMYNRILLNEPI